MVNQMNRVIQYLKLLIISWFTRGKKLWNKIWNKNNEKEILEVHEEEKLTSSDKYNSLFSNRRTIGELPVSERHWDKIMHSLPENFIIPNTDSCILLNEMKATAYDRLFIKASPAPQLFVDRDIWGKIKNNLPSSYLLPTPVFEDSIGPMRSEYYDHLFDIVSETKKVTVDNRIWEQINKNLPVNYKLPIPWSVLNVRPALENSPTLMKHHFI